MLSIHHVTNKQFLPHGGYVFYFLEHRDRDRWAFGPELGRRESEEMTRPCSLSWERTEWLCQ